jgi:hypothetical protein
MKKIPTNVLLPYLWELQENSGLKAIQLSGLPVHQTILIITVIAALCRSSDWSGAAKSFKRIGNRLLFTVISHFNGEMRQRTEVAEPLAIEIGSARLAGDHRDNGTEMSGPKTPKVQVSKPVAFGFDGLA